MLPDKPVRLLYDHTCQLCKYSFSVRTTETLFYPSGFFGFHHMHSECSWYKIWLQLWVKRQNKSSSKHKAYTSVSSGVLRSAARLSVNHFFLLVQDRNLSSKRGRDIYIPSSPDLHTIYKTDGDSKHLFNSTFLKKMDVFLWLEDKLWQQTLRAGVTLW